MMKAGRSTDVTKLDYFKKSKEQWHMQDFVNGEDFCPFIEEPTGSEIRRYHPGNVSNRLRRNRRQKTAAPPPSEKLRRVDLSVE